LRLCGLGCLLLNNFVLVGKAIEFLKPGVEFEHDEDQDEYTDKCRDTAKVEREFRHECILA
jgi:hypothetical protein